MPKTRINSGLHNYAFSAKVWVYNGPSPWHFVTLPKKNAAEIRMFHGDTAKNFGTIGVEAEIGNTRWKTSIFSDSKSQSYVLPLKVEIRKKERIIAGKTVRVTLRIR